MLQLQFEDEYTYSYVGRICTCKSFYPQAAGFARMDSVTVIMDDLHVFISQSLSLILREVNQITADLSSATHFVHSESRKVAAILLSRATYQSIYQSLQFNVSRLYRTVIVLPSQQSFYLPVLLGGIKRLKRNLYFLNRTHLLVGVGSFCLGTCGTLFLTWYAFPRTRYITQMRAVVARSDKGLQGVSYVEEVPLPLFIGPDDILVRVKAAALDPSDVDIAFGRRRVVRELFENRVSGPDYYAAILGRDCAGTVVGTGHNVTRFAIGDEIWLAVPYWKTGTMVEFVSVNECYVSHKPERLDFFDAASLPFSGCIALDCVRRRAGIVDIASGKGKRILVHCGNTATGCIIIQLCALHNVSITTSCTSRAVNKMLDAGAQTVLLLDEISPDATPSRRYDIVFNTVGESAKEFCRTHVVDDGLVIDASAMNYVPSDSRGFVSSLYVAWLKLLQKFGIHPWKDVTLNASLLDELSELINEGKLYPVSDSVFNVKYCERAFWFLQAGKVVGKPVIYFNVPGDNDFYK